jgi:CheY-like chemotaxis protein
VPRILVADDNTNIQKMVSLALQERGVEVTAVGNGEAAVRRLPDLNPDLILADIFMPVRNGYEVCEWVKKDAKYSHIPVILLVGAFDPLDEKEARRVGADGILKKPFIPPDPLIAMVTSTLEKNPRVAAEMALAKQAAAAPPPPPVPAVEATPKVEVKPLPQFPEPSAEEASLAYGFGSGRRGLEDDGSEESAAARAPKSDEPETEEENDPSSTMHEWRRSAMAFEVPEEDSRKPAFSPDEVEAALPSEQDSAPAQIELPQPQLEAEPLPESFPGFLPAPLQEGSSDSPWPELQEQHFASRESASTAEQNIPDLHEQPSEEAGEGAQRHISERGDAGDASQNTTREGESDAEEFFSLDASSAASTATVSPDAPAIPVASAELEISPSATSEAEHSEPVAQMHPTATEDDHTTAERESNSAPKAAHWMDLMASNAGQPQHDWFSTITGAARAEDAAAAHAQANDKPNASESNSFAAESLSAVEQGASPSEEDWFFADEPQAAEPAIAQPHSGVKDSVHAPASAPESIQPEWPAAKQSEPQRDEVEPTVAEPVAVPLSGSDSEIVKEDEAEEPSLSQDPALVESAAVHVTPEPLLIDESPNDGANYNTRDEEVAPAFSFLSEIAKSSAPSSGLLTPEAEDNVASAPLPVETAFPESAAPKMPASPNERQDSPLEFGSSVFDEVAPGAASPSREELARIPFLNPPPEFRHDAEQELGTLASSAPADSAAVDAVVQRIIDKIEPQLRDLLSQNLKPLLENLVQDELHKKDR